MSSLPSIRTQKGTGNRRRPARRQRSKPLFVAQKAPAAARQPGEHDTTDAHTLQTGDLQTNKHTHAPYLAFPTLAQDKPQLPIVDLLDPRRSQGLAIEPQAMSQTGDDRLVDGPFVADKVLLLDIAPVADDALLR